MTTKLLLPFLLLIFFNSNAQVFNWITDVDSAISISNKENKPMLLIFTDANSSKSPLFAQIFNTLDFAIWARDNVVAVKLDLTDDESNGSLERSSSLKKAFGVQELPTICFAKAKIRKEKINYELIGKIGVKPEGVKSWIANAKIVLAGPVEE
ncbi:thioredoxin family protein [Flavobacterium sp. XS1P32]|uniref:thioredoxin family protein n=1 Tax=Flavobacterium sp. XS1P32 TaxID=3401726 RepID=UPI003AAC5F50